MPANPLLRRTATLVTATAIAVPSFAAMGGSAFAAQPAGHGKSAAAHHAKHTHEAKPADHGTPAHPAKHAHEAKPAEGAKPAEPAHEAKPATDGDFSSHNPRGNNGTVFIHDVAGDNRPHNVPHVGCTFYVDFFGFDSSQVLSTSFVGQAPTGAGTPLPSGDWTGTMPADGASGAGRDFDAEQAFTLELSALGAPQAQQGYHVKLTVATGEPGGVKHKVFWVSGCEQPAPAVAPEVAPAAEHAHVPAVVGGLRADRTATPAPRVLGLSVSRTLPAGATRVLAVSADRTPSALPFTGAPVGLLAALAGSALTVGAGLLAAGRRRTGITG